MIGIARDGPLVLSLFGLAGCGAKADDAFKAFPVRDVAWTEVTKGAGLPATGFQCLVFDDLDDDGRPDILLGTATPANSAPPILTAYRNRGDGAFEATPVTMPGEGLALSCDAADFTNDGILDLVIGRAPRGVTLLRGLGGLAFEDASDLLPAFADQPGVFGAATAGFFDFDRDGWLDLYLGFSASLIADSCTATADDFTCTGQPRDWQPARLLRNDAGAAFREMDAPPGDASSLSINGAAFVDWDADGFQDLFVSQDFAKNSLYRNDAGSGRFDDLAPALGIDRYGHAMGAALGDFDRDGLWDLYIADAGPDQFYFGVEDGTMIDRAAEIGVADWTRYHSGWSPVAGDLNLDGFLDLFVVNSALTFRLEDLERVTTGMTISAGQQADFYYVNDQGGGFGLGVVEHAAGSLASVAGGAAAMADYDGDGDLDLVEFYMAPPHFRLLRNDTQDAGHWLAVWLAGPGGRAAGAEVSVVVDGRNWASAVAGVSGSPGKSWRALHFGLGAYDEVDAVSVRWGDGTEERTDGPIAADQALRIGEP